jgi:hypothetical protein
MTTRLCSILADLPGDPRCDVIYDAGRLYLERPDGTLDDIDSPELPTLADAERFAQASWRMDCWGMDEPTGVDAE